MHVREDIPVLLYNALRNNSHHLLMTHSVPNTVVRVFRVILFNSYHNPKCNSSHASWERKKQKEAESLRNYPKLSELVYGRAEPKYTMSKTVLFTTMLPLLMN